MLTKENIKFENISLDEGLSQSVVSCIIQDYIGFMWFGTQDGLNMYDGNKFIVYKHDRDDVRSITNNYICCIYEDSSKNLWTGTENGLSVYDRDENCFINYCHDAGDKNSLPNNQIRTIFEDSKKNLWIGTYGGGLVNFDRIKNNFIIYRNDENDPSSPGNDRITSVAEDSSGNLCIGTWGGGLNLFDVNTGKFSKYRLSGEEENDISIRRINSLLTDSSGKLFVCTNNGLYEHVKENEFISYRNEPSKPTSISGNLVSLIFEDSSKNYWSGTRESGLNLFNRQTGEFTAFKTGNENPQGISNNSIMSFYEDRSGIIWVGTNGGGLNKLNKQSKKILHYFSDAGNANSLSSNHVYCFYEDGEENLWIGTWDNGLNKFERSGNTFVHYNHNDDDPDSLSHNMITSIIQDNDKNLWIGTSGFGINKLNTDSGKISHLRKDSEKKSISHETIFSLAKDKQGNIWIGTGGGGLNKFDLVTGEFIHYKNDPADENSISSNRVRTIFIDSNGVIWIGTDNGGLNKFDEKKNKFIRYMNMPDDSSSISENNIFSIYEDSRGILWIGTMNNGLNKLNRSVEKKETFTRYRERDGLPNDSVNGILEDKEGNLWISTNNGLSKYNPVTETFRNYNAKDGFQSNEFNQGACLKLRSGEFSFGGINGFNIFDPGEIKDNSFIPPVVISDFRIFNKPVIISGENSPLKKSITVTDEIVLSYKDSVFTFEFSSLDFNIPGKNQYAYMMERFDKDWVDSGNRRFATYTNLDPGEYLFRVKGSNNDGVWNEEGSEIKIKITPPFWKTWWFRALSAATVTGAAGGVYQNKLNKVRKEKKAQEDFTKRLIDVQETDRKKIAEELHHSIGHDLLISKNKLLLSMKNSGDNEYLVQNINEVSDIITDTLRDVREISYSLHPYQIERLGLSKAIKSIVDRVSKSSEINFTTSIDTVDKLISSEFEISLYRIIQECINNIVKHSGAGEVILNISRGANEISILISDNGIGFSPEKIKANSEKHGFGLSGMSERIKIFKGKFNIASQPGNGTNINISIPFKNAESN